MEAGAVVVFVGDERLSPLTRGLAGVVQRVGRRGADVLFAGRSTTTTSVPLASLSVRSAASPQQRRRNVAARYGVDPGDVVALVDAALAHDEASSLALVDALSAMPPSAVLQRALLQPAHQCFEWIWTNTPSPRPSPWLFWAARARDRRCFDFAAAQSSPASVLYVLDLATSNEENALQARAFNRRAVVRLLGELKSVPLPLANRILLVWNGVHGASVRDAVVDVLTRGRSVSNAGGFACPICAETTTAEATVFTAAADGTLRLAGSVCARCLQATTATRSALFGADHVLQANATGATAFLLNREPIAFVLLGRRLFTYAEFTAAYNLAGVGASLPSRRVRKALRLKSSNSLRRFSS